MLKNVAFAFTDAIEGHERNESVSCIKVDVWCWESPNLWPHVCSLVFARVWRRRVVLCICVVLDASFLPFVRLFVPFFGRSC